MQKDEVAVLRLLAAWQASLHYPQPLEKIQQDWSIQTMRLLKYLQDRDFYPLQGSLRQIVFIQITHNNSKALDAQLTELTNNYLLTLTASGAHSVIELLSMIQASTDRGIQILNDHLKGHPGQMQLLALQKHCELVYSGVTETAKRSSSFSQIEGALQASAAAVIDGMQTIVGSGKSPAAAYAAIHDLIESFPQQTRSSHGGEVPHNLLYQYTQQFKHIVQELWQARWKTCSIKDELLGIVQGHLAPFDDSKLTPECKYALAGLLFLTKGHSEEAYLVLGSLLDSLGLPRETLQQLLGQQLENPPATKYSEICYSQAGDSARGFAILSCFLVISGRLKGTSEIAYNGWKREWVKSLIFEAFQLQYSRALAPNASRTEMSLLTTLEAQICETQLLANDISFECLNSVPSVHLTVIVSGWLNVEEDIAFDWQPLASYQFQKQTHLFRWRASCQQVSPFSGLEDTLDYYERNDLSLSLASAEEQGERLARTVGALGSVSLVGFSMGASVVLKCLQELRRTGSRAVHDVILIGGAASSADWEAVKGAIGGKLQNVYSESDTVLGGLFTMMCFQRPVGVQRLEAAENFNVTEFVGNQFEYSDALEQILDLLKFNTY